MADTLGQEGLSRAEIGIAIDIDYHKKDLIRAWEMGAANLMRVEGVASWAACHLHHESFAEVSGTPKLEAQVHALAQRAEMYYPAAGLQVERLWATSVAGSQRARSGRKSSLKSESPLKMDDFIPDMRGLRGNSLVGDGRVAGSATQPGLTPKTSVRGGTSPARSLAPVGPGRQGANDIVAVLEGLKDIVGTRDACEHQTADR